MAPFHAMLEEREFKLLQNVFYFCINKTPKTNHHIVEKANKTQ